jgi:glucose/arabinose dehydrogenase
VIKIAGVEHVGEGGLQGLAIHPDFSSNHFIYLYLTTKSNGNLINRVDRYTLDGDTLSNKTVILDNIPGAKFHDGGRMAFGPDDKLYITTGDATQENRAQDINYLGGKILRINDDGSIPDDNPFNSAIYSYGHRNPQGLAWDQNNNLWITEHGRSFPKSGYDEINFIESGKNYGWPEVQGPDTRSDVVSPYVQSGADFTWAPAGAVFYNGTMIFAGLRGEALYQLDIETKNIKTHFFGDFGRLRAVMLGHNGFIYISTSNTDGRGTENSNDDKIIKINPKILE